MSVKIDIGDLTDHTVEITFRDATGTRRRLLLDPERACGRVDLRQSERAVTSPSDSVSFTPVRYARRRL